MDFPFPLMDLVFPLIDLAFPFIDFTIQQLNMSFHIINSSNLFHLKKSSPALNSFELAIYLSLHLILVSLPSCKK